MTEQTYRYIKIFIVIVLTYVLIEELAYWHWRKMNPGHIFSAEWGNWKSRLVMNPQMVTENEELRHELLRRWPNLEPRF